MTAVARATILRRRLAALVAWQYRPTGQQLLLGAYQQMQKEIDRGA